VGRSSKCSKKKIRDTIKFSVLPMILFVGLIDAKTTETIV
jgi:hypothetical protein